VVVETETDANWVGIELWYDGSGIWDHTTKLKHDLNQQQRHELGHKLNTTDSERELCKRLNTVLVGEIFFGFSVDSRMNAKSYLTRIRVNLMVYLKL